MVWIVCEFQSAFQNIGDLQIAHSSEVTIEDPSLQPAPDLDPDPDPVSLLCASALPEHDYSVTSEKTISSLLQKNIELEAKCQMLEARNSKLEKENSKLKGSRCRLRLRKNALEKQNRNFKRTNEDYR